LPPVSTDFSKLVAEQFGFAKGANPFDPTGEVVGRPEKVSVALRGFIDKNEFTEVLVATPVFKNATAERLLAGVSEAVHGANVRLLFSMWGAGAITSRQRAILEETGSPVLANSARAIRALGLYYQYVERSRNQLGSGHADPTVVDWKRPRSGLYADVRAAMAALGIPMPQATVARSVTEAVAVAEMLGYPVVMKANVPSTTHKSAQRMVRVGLGDPEAVEAAFTELSRVGQAAGGDGVVVEQMAEGGLQVLVGGHRDPEFGPLIVVGGGGIAVEYLGDTALMPAGIGGREAAADLLSRTGSGRFLRERSPVAAETLIDIVARVSAWFGAAGEVAAFDLNPALITLDSGRIVFVDARLEMSN
jgi:acyl-CoA synthetase (NDP forming)